MHFQFYPWRLCRAAGLNVSIALAVLECLLVSSRVVAQAKEIDQSGIPVALHGDWLFLAVRQNDGSYAKGNGQMMWKVSGALVVTADGVLRVKKVTLEISPFGDLSSYKIYLEDGASIWVLRDKMEKYLVSLILPGNQFGGQFIVAIRATSSAPPPTAAPPAVDPAISRAIDIATAALDRFERAKRTVDANRQARDRAVSMESSWTTRFNEVRNRVSSTRNAEFSNQLDRARRLLSQVEAAEAEVYKQLSSGDAPLQSVSFFLNQGDTQKALANAFSAQQFGDSASQGAERAKALQEQLLEAQNAVEAALAAAVAEARASSSRNSVLIGVVVVVLLVLLAVGLVLFFVLTNKARHVKREPPPMRSKASSRNG